MHSQLEARLVLALVGLVLGLTKSELNGVVAVLLIGLDLGNNVWSGLNEGDTHNIAFGVEELSHAEFSAEDSFHATVLLQK